MCGCAAFGCTSRSSKKIPGITFHGFPRDEERKQLWIKNVRRPNWAPTQYTKLCSAHFPEEMIDRTSLMCVRLRENAYPTIFQSFQLETDIENYMQLKLQGGRVYLKKDVIPHKFECQKSVTSTSPARHTGVKRRRSKLLTELIEDNTSTSNQQASTSNQQASTDNVPDPINHKPNCSDQRIRVHMKPSIRRKATNTTKNLLNDRASSPIKRSYVNSSKIPVNSVTDKDTKDKGRVTNAKKAKIEEVPTLPVIETLIKQEADGVATAETVIEQETPSLPIETVIKEADILTTDSPSLPVIGTVIKQEVISPDDASNCSQTSELLPNSTLDTSSFFCPTFIKQEVIETEENVSPVIWDSYELPSHNSIETSQLPKQSNSKKIRSDSKAKSKRNPPKTPRRRSIKTTKSLLVQESQTRTKDHFDAYGEYIATKLRDMDYNSCAYVKKMIGNLIYEADMGKYSSFA